MSLIERRVAPPVSCNGSPEPRAMPGLAPSLCGSHESVKSIGRGTVPRLFWGGSMPPGRTQKQHVLRLIPMGGWRDSFVAKWEKSRTRFRQDAELQLQFVELLKGIAVNRDASVMFRQLTWAG